MDLSPGGTRSLVAAGLPARHVQPRRRAGVRRLLREPARAAPSPRVDERGVDDVPDLGRGNLLRRLLPPLRRHLQSVPFALGVLGFALPVPATAPSSSTTEIATRGCPVLSWDNDDVLPRDDCQSDVTVDATNNRRGSMMNWVVEAIVAPWLSPRDRRHQTFQPQLRSCETAVKEKPAHPEAPLVLLPRTKTCERESSRPVLLISDGINAEICYLFPYTRNQYFRDGMGINITDVLYSSGDWCLVREDMMISFWNVNLETKWIISEVDEVIHQGYFSGKPPSDAIVILAQQDPPPEEEESVTKLWLRSISVDAKWKRGEVKFSYEHRGLNSIILYQDMLFWMSDNGSLCCVKQNSNALDIDVCVGACISIGMNFSLVENSNRLYIVKSGGFLPREVPAIYEVIPGVPIVILERRLNGKDIFIVHKQAGFMLQSYISDDCRVFTGDMLPNVDCSMYSYKDNQNENMKPCEMAHHLFCNTMWAVFRSRRQL